MLLSRRWNNVFFLGEKSLGPRPHPELGRVTIDISLSIAGDGRIKVDKMGDSLGDTIGNASDDWSAKTMTN
jgi:hypothetical protein